MLRKALQKLSFGWEVLKYAYVFEDRTKFLFYKSIKWRIAIVIDLRMIRRVSCDCWYELEDGDSAARK